MVPYIISLSALMVMMKGENVPATKYRLNVVVGLVATLYSTYALYASGKDAVLGVGAGRGAAADRSGQSDG